MQKIADALRAGEKTDDGPLTVAAYAKHWLKERRERGVASIVDDECRLKRHVLPTLGALHLGDVRSKHVRDLVRALVTAGALAPRTIRNVYGVTHALFHDALVEELVAANPCVLKRNELPKKIDKDGEWGRRRRS